MQLGSFVKRQESTFSVGVNPLPKGLGFREGLDMLLRSYNNKFLRVVIPGRNNAIVSDVIRHAV